MQALLLMFFATFAQLLLIGLALLTNLLALFATGLALLHGLLAMGGRILHSYTLALLRLGFAVLGVALTGAYVLGFLGLSQCRSAQSERKGQY